MADFDASRFRQVLGHFPTGVTVITATHEDRPYGLTIGSFTSVSLDPPLVGFLPMEASLTWPRIEASGKFCVNVLGAGQGELCWHFAKSDEESRFEGVDWHASPLGSPIIDDVIAWVDCTIEEVHQMGDHLFVLGRVADLDTWEGPEPAPLLFFRGTLGGFAKFAG